MFHKDFFPAHEAARKRFLKELQEDHKKKYPHYDALVGKPIKQAEKNKRKCDGP